MTIINTVPFDETYSKVLDDNLQICVSKDTTAGQELSRTKKFEWVHPDLHTDLLNSNENITTNGQNYILVE